MNWNLIFFNLFCYTISHSLPIVTIEIETTEQQKYK